MRTWFISRKHCLFFSLGAGLVLALLLAAAQSQLAFADTCAAVRGDTLRLHICAADNTVREQTRKLRVRDALLVQAARLCGRCTSRQAAEAALAQNLPLLVHTAQRVLAATGRPEPVTAVLETDAFATTRYAQATLPAGSYRALRVCIGGGAGHNWWCCLYPSLCLAASGARYEHPAENRVVLGDYELRFALVEWWEKARAAQQ